MTTDSLEHVFSTHADEIYQAALLLTLEAKRAEALILRAARVLTATNSAPDAISWHLAVYNALPAKQPQPTKKHWPGITANKPLLDAIAMLPPAQRMALNVLLRHDYAFAQAAPAYGDDPPQAGQALVDGLLALAPVATPDVPLSLFTGIDAAECQHVRSVLALDAGATFDQAVRGHLAICSACRNAEQAWSRLRSQVERALRDALRNTTMPPTLHASVVATFAPRVPFARRLLKPRFLQIALPVAVLLLVAALVLPGRVTQQATGANGVASSVPARELVQRALTNLYVPTPGDGTWHSRYEIRWSFSDELYAMFVGDLWTEGGGRYRAQVVHRDGGAPYEFLLSDGGANIWYSSTALYGQSVYGPLHDAYANQVKISALADQQPLVWQERLASGAWGLAGSYLRSAIAAETLNTWGRQRAANGDEQMVIGYTTTSPLDLAADVPNAPGAITVLLTVDTATNRLNEVREVRGPAGGEQVSRTIWRLVLDEHESMTQSGGTFNVATAFNGPGQFAEVNDEHGLADPALPMIPASAIQPATDSVSSGPGGRRLPSQVPAGIDRAIVLAPHAFAEATVAYLGQGRLLLVNQTPNDSGDNTPNGISNVGRQLFERGSKQVALDAGIGKRFAMRMQERERESDPSVTTVYAIGFTQAEMLAIADATTVFDINQYIANIRLFRSPVPHDPQAFEALVAALQSQPLADGQARRMVVETSQLQGQFADALSDPYHLPYYPNSPTTDTTLWAMREAGRLSYLMQTRDNAGNLVNQTLSAGTRQEWFDRNHDILMYSPITALDPIKREPITEPLWSVINLLGCGGTTISNEPDGTRIVTQIDADWFNHSCNRSQYGSLLIAQLGGPSRAPRPLPRNYGGFIPEPDAGPYLLNATDQSLYQRIFINQNGQAYRHEIRIGSPTALPILESSEIISDATMPVASIPAGTFDPPAPAALMVSRTVPRINESPRTTTVLSLTNVLAQMTTPLWYLPPNETTSLRDVQATLITPDQFFGAADVFENAMQSGFAYRFAYAPPPNDPSQVAQYMFVGSAERFGGFLRAQRPWRTASPMTIEIDGQSVDVWMVTTSDRKRWTLLERDGSLIALDTSTPQRFERLAELRRYIKE